MSHEKDVAEIVVMNTTIECDTDEILREINSLRKQSTAIIGAKNKLELAKMKAEAKAVKVASEA